jgi:GNAT superfamily N-acetyltransferase
MTAFVWRAMSAADLAAVSRIAAAVHPDFPEDDAVFAERRDLCPEGCHVLVRGEADLGGALAGYVLSHPWMSGSCPPLNVRLGALPDAPDTFYIHDLALLPVARGSGAAGAIIDHLRATARDTGFSRLGLVAVNNSTGFWRRQGFESVDGPELDAKLASYGAGSRYMTCALT